MFKSKNGIQNQHFIVQKTIMNKSQSIIIKKFLVISLSFFLRQQYSPKLVKIRHIPASQFNQNLSEGLPPFKVNQKTNLTQKDFPLFRLIKDSQVQENDLLYQRKSFIFRSKTFDGKMPFSTQRRIYSLTDDLIDLNRSSSNALSFRQAAFLSLVQ